MRDRSMQLHEMHATLAVTCPFCHMELKRAEPVWTCPLCSTRHHDECARDNGRCTVMGCGAIVRCEPRAPEVVSTAAPTTPAMSLAGRLLVRSAVALLAVLVLVPFLALLDTHHRILVHAGTGAFVIAGSIGLALAALMTFIDDLRVHRDR
jgi:hypothetical protein